MSHASKADRLLIKPTAGARPASPCTPGRFIRKAHTRGLTPDESRTTRTTPPWQRPLTERPNDSHRRLTLEPCGVGSTVFDDTPDVWSPQLATQAVVALAVMTTGVRPTLRVWTCLPAVLSTATTFPCIGLSRSRRLGSGDSVERGVELAVAAAVESVALDAAGVYKWSWKPTQLKFVLIVAGNSFANVTSTPVEVVKQSDVG
jgi:hypothetical protein